MSEPTSGRQRLCFSTAAGGPAFDPHLLDDDRDGYACELLP